MMKMRKIRLKLIPAGLLTSLFCVFSAFLPPGEIKAGGADHVSGIKVGAPETGKKPLFMAREEAREATFFAMDTIMSLKYYGDAELTEEAKQMVEELEDRLSITKPESEISRVNASEETILSEDTFHLLETALQLCELTDGALDITVYPVVREWGFTTGSYRVPEEEELEKLLELVDYSAAVLDEDDMTIRLPEGMMADLGSVAKGWTGDHLLELFAENGVESALVNLGGNVQTLGRKPDGSFWKVAVQDPGSDGYLGVLSIENEAVVTSGGYERYFEEDGKTYWHIIDPATGYPAESGLLSVTIVGNQGVICDALSTALFVMGREKAEAFWLDNEDLAFDFILATDDGDVIISEGLEGRFKTMDDYAKADVTVVRREMP